MLLVLAASAAGALALALPAVSFAAPQTFTVTSAGDTAGSTSICTSTSKTCTLREAINSANSNPGKDTIVFTPLKAGTVIKPAAALPTITDAVIIDGTSKGCAGAPAIVLNGSKLSGSANGLNVTSAGVTVCGLVIQAFPGSGIAISSSGSDKVVDNYIGTDLAGGTAAGNGTAGAGAGVTLLAGNNAIGGGAAGTRNLISGNRQQGILIQGNTATGNTVQGNYIGTNLAGSAKLANGANGVAVVNAPSNTVGGTTAAARNLISGNGAQAVLITNNASLTGNATGNQVVGNYIGTNAAGSAAVGIGSGVEVDSAGNTIGGTTGTTPGGPCTGACNLISGGNQYPGSVYLQGAANQVLGNYIGTDASGKIALGGGGVVITGTNNTIGGPSAAARNVISGQSLSGITLSGVYGPATGNQVLGNYIGTNAAGTGPLGNTADGVDVVRGAGGEVIGGSIAGAGNVISGNAQAGVLLQNGSSAGSQVLGNYIGTNATGTAGLGNKLYAGVVVQGANNTIGGSAPGARNVISGNTGDGVQIAGSTAAGNQVLGNYVGLDATGGTSIPNSLEGIRVVDAANTRVGGTAAGAGNVVSGNGDTGIFIYNSSSASGGATGTQVLGNYIGTNASGTSSVGNAFDGIVIQGVGGEMIGGSSAGARNVISGNTHEGVTINNGSAAGSQVLGNYIGTNATGTAGLGNKGAGVFVLGPGNAIGGTSTGAGNVVSANPAGVVVEGSAASGNQVLGNYIGTNAAGTASLGNSWGLEIRSAPNNTVGGTSAGARNLISGNSTDGVLIDTDSSVAGTATGNQVLGNYIGVTAGGNAPLGNGTGIDISSAPGNTIGGAIGTTPGGSCIGACNIISANAGPGIAVEGSSSTGDSLTQNSIGGNGGLGIDLGNNGVTPNGSGPTGPNDFQNYPVLSSAVAGGSGTTVNGTLSGANGMYRVEFFDDPSCDPSGNGEGNTYIGFADVSANTPFTFTSSVATTPGDVITATATDGSGNTSEFSQCVAVKTQPKIATTLSQTSITVGGQVHDSATLPGATSDDGGTVTYTVYSDSACTQNARDAGTKTVTNASVPDSDSLTFNSAGTFYWQASYSGDAKNNPATSSCTSEQLTVASATSSSGALVYVANAAGNTASEYQSGSGGALSPLSPATVGTGADPVGVAVSPDGKSAYVTDYNDNTVSQYDIDATTGALTAKSPATISSGTGPIAIAVSPDGKSVYVANLNGNTVSQYDVNATTGALTAKTPALVNTGNSPQGIAVSPDGKSVYVTNGGDSTVAEYDVDATTGTLSPKSPSSVGAGSNPRGIAVSPDGKSVYVTNQSGGTVSQYDVDATTEVLSPKTVAMVAAGIGPFSVAVSPDGKSVYVTNFTGNTVSQYDVNPTTETLSAKTPATVSTGNNPRGIAVSPDGMSVYVTNGGDNTVSQYDVNATTGTLSAKTAATVSAGSGPYGIAIGSATSVGSSVAVAVAAGDRHTCALTSGGEIKCWGYNGFGQLGIGSHADSPTPVAVSGLQSGMSAIAGGEVFTCALTSGGAVKCWGSNSNGQLGNGTTTDSLVPVDVSGLQGGVRAIAAGGGHACALMSAGAVKCWGRNRGGQLGDGSTTDSSLPVDVSGLQSGVIAIAAGEDHTCALMSGGAVKCWGSNGDGQLGDGTYASSTTPVDVSGLQSGMSAIAVSADGLHTCALTSGGAAECWGSNPFGELGDGTTTYSTTPVDVSGLQSGVGGITAGFGHTCAVAGGGAVKCWGLNDHGQLGDGTNADSSTPVDVSGLQTGMSAVTVGDSHTCALTSRGAVKCWGLNYDGQLGDGTTTDSSTPVDVIGF